MTTKTFTINGIEYSVERVTAIADCDNKDEGKRQNALLVTSEQNGEKFNAVVFGWDFDMLNDISDFEAMCEDSCAWESDYEVLESIDSIT